jgi:hypothetical protein
MADLKEILVIGGTGAQGMPVVKGKQQRQREVRRHVLTPA